MGQSNSRPWGEDEQRNQEQATWASILANSAQRRNNSPRFASFIGTSPAIPHKQTEPLQGSLVIPVELLRSQLVGKKEIPNVLAAIAPRRTQDGFRIRPGRPAGPDSPAGMRSDITDRLPPHGRAISRRFPATTCICCSGPARAHCTNWTRQSAGSKVSKRQRQKFPFSPIETPNGHATVWECNPRYGLSFCQTADAIVLRRSGTTSRPSLTTSQSERGPK